MTKEQKRRPPVFTPAEDPVAENIDDILMGNTLVEERAEPIQTEEVTKASEEEGVLPNGWKRLSVEQQTGKQYFVTANTEEEGERAFWRKTRVLSHFKWKIYGKWTNALTHQDILPSPIYYKDVG